MMSYPNKFTPFTELDTQCIDSVKAKNSKESEVIRDLKEAREILFRVTLSKIQTSESVNTILKDLKEIYANSPSSVLQRFGRRLNSKNVICAIASLRPDIKEYEHFRLEPLRSICHFSIYSHSVRNYMTNKLLI